MHHAHSLQVRFDFLAEVEIRAAFDGGAVTSDAGLLLVAQIEEVGLLRSLAAVIDDPRQLAKCRHSTLELLTQRVMALVLGMRTVTTTPFSVTIQG
ncbi:MAG: hypothetical protein GX134_02870 [candidate division WS1 bacterium]|jgi:hypothetical protein|nr:hypothetical protein [candidate division WS1 bacterium]